MRFDEKTSSFRTHCPICGDITQAGTHEECAKETQRIHAADKKPKKHKKLSKKVIERMADYAKKHYE